MDLWIRTLSQTDIFASRILEREWIPFPVVARLASNPSSDAFTPSSAASIPSDHNASTPSNDSSTPSNHNASTPKFVAVATPPRALASAVSPLCAAFVGPVVVVVQWEQVR
jgi:hypothetical protein